MATDNFIPEIWSREILSNLRKAYRFAQAGVINRNYEGEIKSGGDTVRINSLGALSVQDYSRNEDVATPQTLTSAQRSLLIDQEKLVQFYVDDVDAKQANTELMTEAMVEVADALANVADQHIASVMAAAATDAGAISVSTPDEAYDLLVDLAVLLDEGKAPESDRWAIVTPAFHGLLQKSARFVASGSAEADARLRNGVIGSAAGFTIAKSLNTVAGADVQVGHGVATTFAEQIVQTERLRSERRVADLVRALHVYGAKVVRPSCLVKASIETV